MIDAPYHIFLLSNTGNIINEYPLTSPPPDPDISVAEGRLGQGARSPDPGIDAGENLQVFSYFILVHSFPLPIICV